MNAVGVLGMAQEQGMGALLLSGVMVPSTVSFECLGTARARMLHPGLLYPCRRCAVVRYIYKLKEVR